MRERVFILFALLAACFNAAIAQSGKAAKPFSVQGTVIDSATSEKLPGATIRIISADNKHLIGAITGSNGEFKIDRVSFTDVTLQISQVGYKTKVMTPFQEGKTSYNLGSIKLQSSAVMMGEVEIKSQRPIIEYFPDKQVLNMERIPGATGSVTDALRNSGAVDIDPTNNKISIRGKSNVTIQIDGKPMPMAEDMLSQMPANMIEQVEITTNPSAKDDPEGDAGIINFITKRGMSDNYSGSFSLFRSNKNMSYGSMFINYKKSALNLYGSINGGLGEFLTGSSNYQTNYQSTLLHTSISNGNGSRKGFMTNAKLGMDYDFDTLNSFSLSGSFNKMKGDGYNHDNYSIFDNTGAARYSYNLNNDGSLDNNVFSLSSNYKKKFDKKGHEISADVFLSYTDNDNPFTIATTYNYDPNNTKKQNTDNNTLNKTFIGKLDYTNPQSGIGKLETGYNFTFRDRTTDYYFSNYNPLAGVWVDDPNFSNNFSYQENIHAVYATLSNKLWVLDYKLGARVEQIFSNGMVRTTGQEFDLNYSSFFPSLNISYQLAPNMPATLTIARRIRRPQMEFINPFKKINGPNSYSIGNPDLKPNYTNAYEIGISPFIKGYYTTSTGRPVSITAVVNDSISQSTMVNNASTTTYGVELTIPIMNDPRFPFKLPDWLLMCNIQTSWNHTEEANSYLTEDYTVKRNVWNIGGQLGFKLWYDVTLVFFGRYTPQVEDSRTIQNPRSMLGLSMSKEFMNKKLKVSLNVLDIFNKNMYETQTKGTNYYQDSRFTNLNSQFVGISIQYLFNDFKARQERNIDDGRDKTDSGMF